MGTLVRCLLLHVGMAVVRRCVRRDSNDAGDQTRRLWNPLRQLRTKEEQRRPGWVPVQQAGACCRAKGLLCKSETEGT